MLVFQQKNRLRFFLCFLEKIVPFPKQFSIFLKKIVELATLFQFFFLWNELLPFFLCEVGMFLRILWNIRFLVSTFGISFLTLCTPSMKMFLLTPPLVLLSYYSSKTKWVETRLINHAFHAFCGAFCLLCIFIGFYFFEKSFCLKFYHLFRQRRKIN